MKIYRVLAPIAFATCLSLGASAQEASTKLSKVELASCMLANSGETEEAALKDMMLKALMDAPTEELQASVNALGMIVVGLAVDSCDVAFEDLSAPSFGEAAEIYGTKLGEKVMSEAMAKVGG